MSTDRKHYLTQCFTYDRTELNSDRVQFNTHSVITKKSKALEEFAALGEEESSRRLQPLPVGVAGFPLWLWLVFARTR